MIEYSEIEEKAIPQDVTPLKVGDLTKEIYIKGSEFSGLKMSTSDSFLLAKNKYDEMKLNKRQAGDRQVPYIRYNSADGEAGIGGMIMLFAEGTDGMVYNVKSFKITTTEYIKIEKGFDNYFYCLKKPVIPTIDKVSTTETLENVVKKNIEIKNSIDACKNKLSYILNDKKCPSVKTEKLSTLIDKVETLGDLSANIYGVSVDETNDNTNYNCEYIDKAYGKGRASHTSLTTWEDIYPFNKIRLVGFQNGAVTKEINSTDKTKYKDGELVPVDVDVMVEIPKVYFKFSQTEKGYEVRISEKKFEGSDCYAHKVNGVEKDYIYVGAYLGYEENGKLRSKSGVFPTKNKTLAQFRTLAQANGNGYQQMTWFTLVLLQVLYLILYRNLHSQGDYGLGYGCILNSKEIMTGGTNTKGMLFGDARTYDLQNCFLGIEDFWGNLNQFIDGLYIDNSLNITVENKNKNFTDRGINYKKVGKYEGALSNDGNQSGDFFTKVMATNEMAFFPKDIYGGGSSSYYSDTTCINKDRIAYFGGDYTSNAFGGVFHLMLKNNVANEKVGARLCYLG